MFPKCYTFSAKYVRCQHKRAYLLAKGRALAQANALGYVIPWTTYAGN